MRLLCSLYILGLILLVAQVFLPSPLFHKKNMKPCLIDQEMMFGESSSEESEEKTSSDSDYVPSESSSDGNGDEDVGSIESRTIATRRRPKSVLISIPEAIKMRRRSSGISIREPTESPILLGPPWQNRRPRDTARRPAQRFKNPDIVHAVSTQAQVNSVNGGSITTTLVAQVGVNTRSIATSFESGHNPWSSSLQESSSGSNMFERSSVSASNTIECTCRLLGSSSSSVQSPANIATQMASSSMHMRCLDLNQPAKEDEDQNMVEEEEDEGLDLNKPATEIDEDEKKDEGLDLNKPANEGDDDEIMVENENEGMDLNKPATEGDDDEIMVENENEGMDLNKPANDDSHDEEEEDKGLDLNQPAPDE